MPAKSLNLDCPECGAVHRVEADPEGTQLETWPCQGSDECQKRLCESCRIQCHSCGLYACSEHIVDLSGETLCMICAKGYEADGDPICAQPVALLAQLMARDGMALREAGLTVAELEAISGPSN